MVAAKRLSIVALIVVGAGVNVGVAQSASSRVSAPSVAYKLATIDCKCAPSSARVRSYAQSLAVLAGKKCRESKPVIGNMAVVATELLAKRHIRMSIPASLGRTRCADIFAAFVTLVESR